MATVALALSPLLLIVLVVRAGVRRVRRSLCEIRKARIARGSQLPRVSLDGATPVGRYRVGQPIEIQGRVAARSRPLRGDFVAYAAEKYTHEHMEEFRDYGENDHRISYSGELAWRMIERNCPGFYLAVGAGEQQILQVAGGGRSRRRTIASKGEGLSEFQSSRDQFERGPGYDLVIVSSASPFRQRLRESAAPALGAERVTGMRRGDTIHIFGHIGFADIEALAPRKAIVAEKVVVRR